MAGGRAATEAVIRGRAALSVNDPGHPTPPGWVRVALTDVAELGTGHTPSRKHPEYWGGDIPWIGIRDAGAHHGRVINNTAQHTNELGLANSAARLLPEGTVCLSRTASVGYVTIMGRPMATSQDFVTWTCGKTIDPRFLMQALLAEGEDIRRFGEGSTHTTIYFPEVKAFHLDLPPKAEQQRIVSKIDSLSAKSKRIHGRLDHVSTLVESYKKAVVSHLLGRLSATASMGKLSDVCISISDGDHQAPPKANDGVPFITISALNDGEIRLDKATRWVPLEYYRDLKSTRIANVGDILFSVTGSIGISALVREQVPFVFQRHIAIIKPDISKLRSEFALFCLRSLSVREQMLACATGTAQLTVPLSGLRSFMIPVPSFSEQDAAINGIKRAFAWIDRLAVEASSARKLMDRLDQSILTKAFRGSLVPQDPRDESANLLLEKIRAERGETIIGERRDRSRGRSLP